LRGITVLYLVVILAGTVGLGVVVPVKALEGLWSNHPQAWIGVAMAVLALICAAVLGVVGLAIFTSVYYDELQAERERVEEFLNAYRARQRAMLEELDEAVAYLREIRDLLREARGE